MERHEFEQSISYDERRSENERVLSRLFRCIGAVLEKLVERGDIIVDDATRTSIDRFANQPPRDIAVHEIVELYQTIDSAPTMSKNLLTYYNLIAVLEQALDAGLQMVEEAAGGEDIPVDKALELERQLARWLERAKEESEAKEDTLALQPPPPYRFPEEAYRLSAPRAPREYSMSMDEVGTALSALAPGHEWSMDIFPEDEREGGYFGRIESENEYFTAKETLYISALGVLADKRGLARWGEEESEFIPVQIPSYEELGEREEDDADITVPVQIPKESANVFIPVPMPETAKLIGISAYGEANKRVSFTLYQSPAGWYYVRGAAPLSLLRYRLQEDKTQVHYGGAELFERAGDGYSYPHNPIVERMMPIVNSMQNPTQKERIIEGIIRGRDAVYTSSTRMRELYRQLGEDVLAGAEWAGLFGQCSFFAGYTANMLLSAREKAGVASALHPHGQGFGAVGHSVAWARNVDNKLLFFDPTRAANQHLEVDEEALSDGEWEELYTQAREMPLAELLPKLATVGKKLKLEREQPRERRMLQSIFGEGEGGYLASDEREQSIGARVARLIGFYDDFYRLWEQGRRNGDFMPLLQLLDETPLHVQSLYTEEEKEFAHGYDTLRHLADFDPYKIVVPVVKEKIAMVPDGSVQYGAYFNWLIRLLGEQTVSLHDVHDVFESKGVQTYFASLNEQEKVEKFFGFGEGFADVVKTCTVSEGRQYVHTLEHLCHEVTFENDKDTAEDMFERIRAYILGRLFSGTENDVDTWVSCYKRVLSLFEPDSAADTLMREIFLTGMEAYVLTERKDALVRIRSLVRALKRGDFRLDSKGAITVEGSRILGEELLYKSVAYYFNSEYDSASLNRIVEFEKEINSEYHYLDKNKMTDAVVQWLTVIAGMPGSSFMRINYPPSAQETWSTFVLACNPEVKAVAEKIERIAAAELIHREPIESFFTVAEDEVPKKVCFDLRRNGKYSDGALRSRYATVPMILELPTMREELSFLEDKSIEQGLALISPQYNPNSELDTLMRTISSDERYQLYWVMMNSPLRRQQEKIAQDIHGAVFRSNFTDKEAYDALFAVYEFARRRPSEQYDAMEKRWRWMADASALLEQMPQEAFAQKERREEMVNAHAEKLGELDPSFAVFFQTLNPEQKSAAAFVLGKLMRAMSVPFDYDTGFSHEEKNREQKALMEALRLFFSAAEDFARLDLFTQGAYLPTEQTPKRTLLEIMLEFAGSQKEMDKEIQEALATISRWQFSQAAAGRKVFDPRSFLQEGLGLRGRTRGGGEEMGELRDYTPGDDARLIAPEASARRPREKPPLVRQPEREYQTPIEFLVDIAWLGEKSPQQGKRVPEHAARLLTFLALGSKRAPIGVRFYVHGEELCRFSPHELQSALTGAGAQDFMKRILVYADAYKHLHLLWKSDDAPYPADPRALSPLPKQGEVYVLTAEHHNEVSKQFFNQLSESHKVYTNMNM